MLHCKYMELGTRDIHSMIIRHEKGVLAQDIDYESSKHTGGEPEWRYVTGAVRFRRDWCLLNGQILQKNIRNDIVLK